ncbi:hypothetical protein VUR80DRAFT_9294 [Thermomyces stellatus]
MPRPKRTRRGRQPASQDAETAGDAGPGVASSTPAKQITSPQTNSSEKENRPAPDTSARVSLAGSAQQRRALFDATRRRESALRDLEAEEATTSDSLGPWALGDDTTGLGERDRLRRNELSGLDLDDDVFSSMYSGTDRPPSRGRSANTSTISAGQFMRRSRAPSVVSRDGGIIRPSSRGVNTPSASSTLNFGRFRRRAREPSILSTDRRPRRETPSDESELELEGNFAPDAVSTPLERRQTQAAPERSEPACRTSARTRKRKSSEMEGEGEGVRVEKSPRVEQPEQEENNENVPRDNENDVAVASEDSSLSSLSSPRSLASPIPDRGRPSTPVNLDEIMAPPASGGSDSTEWPSIRRLAKRRRRMSPSTPLRAGGYDDASDISSPPSLTHSPNFPDSKQRPKSRGRQVERQPSPSPLTAHLASLLPQRRARHARAESGDVDSGGEMDVLSLADDEDELAFTHSRSRTRGASARPASRGGRQPQSATKNKQTPRSGRRVTRTYGGRESADGSFAPLPDDSFTRTGPEIEDPKEELKKAAQKFKEVDKWELEFEDVTREDSPNDAR